VLINFNKKQPEGGQWIERLRGGWYFWILLKGNNRSNIGLQKWYSNINAFLDVVEIN